MTTFGLLLYSLAIVLLGLLCCCASYLAWTDWRSDKKHFGCFAVMIFMLISFVTILTIGVYGFILTLIQSV